MATVEQGKAERATPVRNNDNGEPLQGLQRQLLQCVSSTPDKLELLQRFAALIAEQGDAEAVFYFQRNEGGQLAVRHQLLPADESERSERLARQLAAACQAACARGELEVRKQASPERTILAAPVALRGQGPEALGVVFSAGDASSQRTMLVQMLTSHLVLWHLLHESRESEAEARESAALLELIEQVETAPDLRHAYHRLAGELQNYLKCRRVALGIRPGGKGRCRLVAISGVARFDRRSQTAQSIEAAFDEAVVRNDLSIWPPLADDARHGMLAHKNVCSIEEADSAISIPLRNQNDDAIAALLLLDEAIDLPVRTQRFLRAAERSMATSLSVMQRLEGGWLVRFGRNIAKAWSSWKVKLGLVIMALLLAALTIPLPYKINSDCQLEPVTRRFVAAPFEGTLEKSFVKPGDIVQRDDVLARMDGREIRWERAGVEADRQQAIKRRDAAQATHDYAEAQIAKLEMQRLQLRLRLLDHRAAHLEIRAPVAGVVASGDLERAEGAPLTVGQTLFEIAPLDKMIVEVAVEDAEVASIQGGQPVTVRLDAFPGETWEASVDKVHPRSEIRDDQNVFIAEAALRNDDGRLRPGMKGRAKIVTPDRSLGWILFHKPWEYVGKKISW